MADIISATYLRSEYCGRKSAKKLKEFGIHTALQFREAHPDWIRRNLSVNGVRMQKELQGEVCYPLELTPIKKKSITTARSFGNEIKKLSELGEAVSSHINNCAIKLRKEKSCCTKVTVFIQTNRFKLLEKQYYGYTSIQLDTPTNDSLELTEQAIQALKTIYKDDCTYKKAGVIVEGLVPEEQMQLSLFDTQKDRGKRNDLMKTLDRINVKMGRGTVKLAVQGSSRRWKLKQEKLSPCYTTRFSDMLKVEV